QLDRVLGGDQEERGGQGVGGAVDGDLPLLHRLQERGLRARGGAVDLVHEQEVGEDGSAAELEDQLARGVDGHPGHVAGPPGWGRGRAGTGGGRSPPRTGGGGGGGGAAWPPRGPSSPSRGRRGRGAAPTASTAGRLPKRTRSTLSISWRKTADTPRGY